MLALKTANSEDKLNLDDQVGLQKKMQDARDSDQSEQGLQMISPKKGKISPHKKTETTSRFLGAGDTSGKTVKTYAGKFEIINEDHVEGDSTTTEIVNEDEEA